MKFTTTINAPRERVWEVLWGYDTYRTWTAPFSEGSRAETDWQKGSKVLFLDGGGSGMVSRIEENVPNSFMGIKHLGIVKDGVEDLESDEVKQWAGSYETYTLTDRDGSTELLVEMGGTEIPKEYAEEFKRIWPVALEMVKELAESK